MKIFIRGAAVALALSVSGVSGVDAQLPTGSWTPWFTFNDCGGNTFQVCFTADLYTNGGDELWVNVTNTGANGTITRLGVVNVNSSATVTDGYNPLGWDFESNNGLTSGGLPSTIWAYNAPPSPMKNGFSQGEGGWFSFDFSPSMYLDTNSIGFGVHAQGYGTCSSKFGFWNRDAGTGGYQVNGPGSYTATDCGIAVPEPGSVPLMALGLIGLAFVASRREKMLEA